MDPSKADIVQDEKDPANTGIFSQCTRPVEEFLSIHPQKLLFVLEFHCYSYLKGMMGSVAGIAVSDIEISWTGLQASRKQYEKVQGESAL